MNDVLNMIWASLPMPALIVDQDDCLQEINSAAELFLNTSRKTLFKTKIFDQLAIDAPLDAVLKTARKDGAPIFINNVDVSSGLSAPIECNIQVSSIQDHHGWLLILFETRQIADRLEKYNKIKRSARSAIGMAEMLAHEIKNPLAGIKGAAQLLAMGLSPEDQELTTLIVDESKRIVSLLDQVEQFGNLRPPKLKPTNIHDLINRAQKSASISYAAHMKFNCIFDPSLPLCMVDGGQIIQVLQNLIKNASEAAHVYGGTIKIKTYYDGSLRIRRKDRSEHSLPLQVQISDDGPGLPSDLSENIFEPFVSGKENGTGLGLALVSKIISEHDGAISVNSVPGKTVFQISLPIETT